MNGFFKESADGRFVKSMNPVTVPKFRVGILKAYMTEDEVVEKDRAFTFSRHILPMPMHVSPVYVALKGDVASRKIINSVDQFLQMRHIYMTFCNNPYREDYNVKTVESHDQLVKEREERLFHDLEIVISAYKTKQKNERETLEVFLSMLAEFTTDLINFMEIAIMESLCFTAPLSTCNLKDFTILALDDQERKVFFETMRYFFKAKQDLANLWLTQAGLTELKCTFGLDEFEERVKNTPVDQVYCGFIDRATAIEYLHFLDFE